MSALKVGDIWVAIGGIGQTRCAFYRVVRFTKASVWIQPIPSKCVKNDNKHWVWHQMPDVDAAEDTEPQRRKLHWTDANLWKHPKAKPDMWPSCDHGDSSYMGRATPWDGKAVIESGMY